MADTLYNDSAPGRRSRLERSKSRLWTERASFDQHWRDIGDYLMPRRTRFHASDRNRGDKRNQNIIDSTARFAARTLASGLHAGLTSPARPWMKLTTSDPDLAEHGPVKEWLHTVTQRMLDTFLKGNLYNVLPMIYGDMGLFGTACMSIMADQKDVFRAYAYPLGSFAISMDRRGNASTFCREYELSVRQVVEEFGVRQGYRDIDWSKISLAVKRMWDNGQYEDPVRLVWMVQPNAQAEEGKIDAKYLPWSSCHWELGQPNDQGSTTSGFLRESGYQTFPIMAPRWDITAEDSYGTDCPGMTALGDVRQLQVMQLEKGKAIKKMVSPPMVAPTAFRTQKTSILPGDITYGDTREGQQGMRPIYQVQIDLEHLRLDMGEVQYRIKRAFYEDLFLMMAQSDAQRGSQPVTAREIDERHEEKLIVLGPVLERTNDELLDPIVDRVYLLMHERGMIPEPPDELDHVDLKVEYISIMAQAQKLVGVGGVDRYMQSATVLAQTFPDVRHKIDINEVMDGYAEMLGVPPKMTRTTEDAVKLQQAEAQAVQQAQQAEQAKTLATAAAQAGARPVAPDSALDRMSQQMGAPGAQSAVA